MVKNTSGDDRQNVKVVCRVRPTNKIEVSKGGKNCVKELSDTDIEIDLDDGDHKFSFDHVFGPQSTQELVYTNSASHLIDDVLGGYNATIFAYGQTGTGKTHTMEGDINSDEDKGVIPRSVEALFDGVSEADENIEFMFKVSYVEIYLEKIRDLLDPHRVKNNLTIREDKVKGIYIAGVTEEYVMSVEELLDIMQTGAANRATAATGMNEGSSRSHSVFTITVQQKNVITSATKSGKLVLVDLAGSEMVGKTGASGARLEEAKTINKSLSALGQVIAALTDKNQTHIPYRDSKLTRVLQESLGGNSKTVLIIAISPSSFNGLESISTMRFGTRAKSIENKITINQTRSVEELETLLVRAEKAIDAQTAHILTLTAQLQSMSSRSDDASSDGDGDEEESIDSRDDTSEADSSVFANRSATKDTPYLGSSSRDGDRLPNDPEALQSAVATKAASESAASNVQAQLIKTLRETIESLNNELDDEKQENAERAVELSQLTEILKDKERMTQDASAMYAEEKRANETWKERAEVLVKEKVDVVGELESVRRNTEEELAKVKFNMMELEVSLNTYVTENRQLKTEIAEMSGDPQNDRGTSHIKYNQDQSFSADNLSKLGGGATNAMNLQVQVSGKAHTPDLTPERAASAQERKQLLDDFMAKFATACVKFNMSEECSAELFSIMDAFSAHQESNIVAMETALESNTKSTSKRFKELEEQRHRLEKDLQTKVENLIKLQQKFDNIGQMNNQQVADMLSEKDKAHRKSLQQRLEQLVAVHRQLLRKFATLELETSELKKKIMLRDERIRQLEGSSTGLIGNIRQQAEKHISELTHHREQIHVLRAEHDQRIDSFNKETDPSHRVIGGGQRKAIRSNSMWAGVRDQTHIIAGGGGSGGQKAGLRGGGGGRDENNRNSNKSISFANLVLGEDDESDASPERRSRNSSRRSTLDSLGFGQGSPEGGVL